MAASINRPLPRLSQHTPGNGPTPSPLLGYLLLCLCLLAACSQPPPQTLEQGPIQVQITADGTTQDITTEATTVREVLAQTNIPVGESDEITPPLFTPLEDEMVITVVRITESIETILQSIPFELKIVRSDAMAADDPPVIVQGGQAGLLEETVRIVYRDGVESERWVTQVTELEPAQDEIRMVGIGAIRDNINFPGHLAFISGGTAVILRGSTLVPEQLPLTGQLDGRVFSLSPSGSHLLYTQVTTQTTGFGNSLWTISTARGAKPRALGVENVLWADWNPTRTDVRQIAYTTANPTNLPPGWEANNDLWLGDLPTNQIIPFEPENVVAAYPASYGWWGGNYAWSPRGNAIAYSYADEVGLINLRPQAEENDRHLRLQHFTDYNTLADWVWVPTLTWSPDGRFLAFTNHNSADATAMVFDSWVLDVFTGVSGRFVEQAGMWGHLHWSPAGGTPFTNTTSLSYTLPISDPLPNSQLAFLKAIDPLDSQRSNYTLWLMDSDGSNSRRIYPPLGENSFFPRDQHFMAWGPDGRFIAFIFNSTLHLLNLEINALVEVTSDDTVASHPTWSPYGAGLLAPPPAPPSEGIFLQPDTTFEDFLPQE